MGREAPGALHPPAEAVVAAEARALARPDRAQLDAAVEPLAKGALEARRVRPLFGLVGEDEPGAVEDELGRDGLQRHTLFAG